MSINKRALLGTSPVEAGYKDAIHVAIVALRAAKKLEPGEHITLNDNGEAIPTSSDKSFGIVDPFLTDNVMRGKLFYGVLNPDEVPNVRHHWDHEKFGFEAPTTPPSRNKYLEQYADLLKISYDELIEACSKMVYDEKETLYNGPLTEQEVKKQLEYIGRDLWYEWSSETGYEFENLESACCPEIVYPDEGLFTFKGEE